MLLLERDLLAYVGAVFELCQEFNPDLVLCVVVRGVALDKTDSLDLALDYCAKGDTHLL